MLTLKVGKKWNTRMIMLQQILFQNYQQLQFLVKKVLFRIFTFSLNKTVTKI